MSSFNLELAQRQLMQLRHDKGVLNPMKIENPKFTKYCNAVSNRDFGAIHNTKKLAQLGLNRYLDGIQPPEFNLLEQAAVFDAEPIVRAAIKRQVSLWFKEPPFLLGDPKYVNYLKERLNQIAYVSKIPTNELFRTLLLSLLKYSNAFAVFIRSTNLSNGVTVNGRPPIAAIIPVSAITMFPKFEDGRLSKWVRILPDGRRYQEFDPIDVIHLTFDREEDFIFGKPRLLGSIEDVAALRRIEENIEILMAKFLFPIYHMIVGTLERPCEYFADGQSEIDLARYQIQGMDQEGMAITSERVKFEVIGALDQALDASGYLDHFKRRLYSGLGVSAIDVGEGDTANRATADNISQNLKDRVIEDQQAFADQIHMQVLLPLIQESKNGWSAITAFDEFKLTFKNIDLDNRIKYENHIINLWNNSLIIEDEARQLLGYSIMTNADRLRTRYFLQDIITLVIGAGDEKWSGETNLKKILSVIPEATGTGGGTGNKAAGATGGRPSKTPAKGANVTKVKSQPQNQFGINPGPTKAKSSLEIGVLGGTLTDLINFIGSCNSVESLETYVAERFTDQITRDRILPIVTETYKKISKVGDRRAELVARLMEFAQQIEDNDENK